MDALRDVGRQLVRNRDAFGKQPDDMPVFGTSAATFNDDGVTALYQELRDAAWASSGCRSEGTCRRGRAPLLGPPPGRAGRAGALPGRDHRDRPRLSRRDRAVCRAAASRVQHLANCVVSRPAAAGRTTEVAEVEDQPVSKPRPRRAAHLRPCGHPADCDSDGRWPSVVEHTPATSRSWSSATENSTPSSPRNRCQRQQDSPRGAPSLAATTANWSASGAARTCPGSSPSLPAFSRSSATTRTRRECSPARVTRPYEPALQGALRRPAGHPALDRLRLGHPLWPRPRPATRHLRQGRHLGRLGGDPG
jgi:hypothetical protein